MTTDAAAGRPGPGEPGPQRLELRLYVAGTAPNSTQAENNLSALLGRAGVADYGLEVIDCLRDPLRALRDGILVTPMLLKVSPEPVQSIIGTLSDLPRVASALGLAAAFHAGAVP